MPADRRQRVQIDPSQPVSRPLRTSREFLLVLAPQRIVQAGWDRALYDPGSDCELRVEGANLKGMELVVEAEDLRGGWDQVARVDAQPSQDRRSACARWRFPAPAQPFVPGHLSRAQWGRDRASPGERLPLGVEGQGMPDGAWLAIQVEREEPDGSWRTVALWQGSLQQGRYESEFELPSLDAQGDAAGGALLEASFLQGDRLTAGETADLVARARGLDGETLWFVLEREEAPGRWVEAGAAATRVRAGEARALLAIPAPDGAGGSAGGALLSARFGGPVEAGAEVELSAEAHGLDGQAVRFLLEAEGASGRWREVAQATAAVEGGSARARVRLPDAGRHAAARFPRHGSPATRAHGVDD
jgi:hypothetical protein